ncbi:MAG TPA: hypothetical protein VFP36_08045 [Usitatibacter sp.]|nr:hypothetical protein [Usitatibacter sp.]
MASTPLDISIARKAGERRLYAWAAAIALAVVFFGFARTYYLKGAFGTPQLSTLKHVHGVLMTSWFILFFVQVRLVATHRTQVHRQLGLFGMLLAALLVLVGTNLGIVSARSGMTPIASVPPLVFLVMPIGEVVVFTTLFTAAVLVRRHGPWHKRLMVLASLAMLTPAMARLPFDFVRNGGPLVFFALTDLVILACIAFDTARSRRLHPAFVAGFVVVVAGQLGRLALSRTPAWNAFAHWLVG